MTLLIADRYEILDQIDVGGFGEVFAVRDTTLPADSSILALKMLRFDRLPDAAAVSRLKREIALGVELPHANLIKVLDHGTEANRLWYVMPYADGGNLTNAIPTTGWGTADVLEVLVPIAGAVAYLHENGALHRDISSNNVLRFGPEWVLSDLGLSVSSLVPTSLRTSTGVAGLGAVGFVSPEQRAGLKNATTRSDIYSLGKLVQHMTEGHWPEHAPVASGPFSAVIGQATRTDPTQRFGTVQELVQAARVVASAPPFTGSVADRVDEFVAGARRIGSTDNNELVGLIASLDPNDEYERKQIERLLPIASQRHWKAAFKDNSDRTLLAIENAALAIYGEGEFRILDGLMAGLLNADRAIDTPQVRHRVVATLAHVGRSNDQWSYQDRLVELLIDHTPGSRVQATVSGLREAGADATRWLIERKRLDEFPNPLRGWLADIIS